MQDNLPQYNIAYRPENIPYEESFCIPTTQGTDSYNLALILGSEDIKDMYIIGMYIRRDSQNSTAPKIAKDGRNIINDTAFLSGHIYLKDNVGLTLIQYLYFHLLSKQCQQKHFHKN